MKIEINEHTFYISEKEVKLLKAFMRRKEQELLPLLFGRTNPRILTEKELKLHRRINNRDKNKN